MRGHTQETYSPSPSSPPFLPSSIPPDAPPLPSFPPSSQLTFASEPITCEPAGELVTGAVGMAVDDAALLLPGRPMLQPYTHTGRESPRSKALTFASEPITCEPAFELVTGAAAVSLPHLPLQLPLPLPIPIPIPIPLPISHPMHYSPLHRSPSRVSQQASSSQVLREWQ
ncbi:unnamed protein product [Closterium sp. NIES-53]